MDDRYLKQATLVVRCIPAIAAEDCFAIKGGTAINLFELNLPRLSVDIDLTFTRITDRPTPFVKSTPRSRESQNDCITNK